MKYQNFIFDLDNTIYRESEYLYPAYDKISKQIEIEKNIPHEEVYDYLTNEFENFGRDKLFNKLINKFDLNASLLSDCLRILRNVSIPYKISPFPQIAKLILELNSINKSLFIFTNGNKIQQQNKIKNIYWPIPIDNFKIVFANDFQPKPSIKGINFIINNYKLKKSETVFIGDSDTDMECANKADIDFISVQNLI